MTFNLAARRLIVFVSTVAASFATPVARADVTIGAALVVSAKEGPIGPRFSECQRCIRMEFSGPGGARFEVTAEPTPRIELRGSDFEEVVVGELPSPSPSGQSLWIVLAIPTAETWKSLNEVMTTYTFDRALISIDGRPTDVNEIAGWSSGIQLGIFRTCPPAEKFARTLGLKVSVQAAGPKSSSSKGDN
jgi:hypothetical protein